MEINNAQAIIICNGIVDALDVTTGGTPPANPVCRIFSGAAPGSPDYADAADPAGPLVDIPLNNPAWQAAADQSPNARAAMDPTPTPSATPTASGTAASFRMRDRKTTTDTIWQGNVGVSASTNDLELSSVSLDTGTAVQLTSWTVDALEGPGL
jgi:hypothetical protein